MLRTNRRLGYSHRTCLILLVLVLDQASADERFPFAIPGDDASRTITDLSHLSPGPAGADGFVRVKGGHFRTDSGRLKIWGVNTCFGANFPSREHAEKVAAHLAKLGINGVRMHHHDGAAAPGGIWGKAIEGQRVFDPKQLDRQDYFLHQLHEHGIYANLNLHVSRTFTEAEGFVSKDLPHAAQYDKYLLYFEPRMRERFKQFCRDYLTHYNPYRDCRRVDDPGIAMIELTNENSFSVLGPAIATGLPEPYRGEFKRQWNRWLKNRYGDTGSLKLAWQLNNETLETVLADSDVWRTELGAWALHQSKEHPVQPVVGQTGPQDGRSALKLDVSAEAPQLHLQELMLPNLKLEAGKAYTLSFWIKADGPRSLYVDVSNQGPADWNNVGFWETLEIDGEWRHVHRVFRVGDNLTDKARLCFKFGGSRVDFTLSDVSLRRGGQWIVLPDGQSIEKGNVDVPHAGWSEPAFEDVRQFMIETEKGFVHEMIDFLKKDLGVRVPVTASQIDYHGAPIVAETCDYADIHAYWQHPRFPRRPWDPVDWTIFNSPLECEPGRDALLARAPWRLVDRPFTLSEWNIPDPSDYAASVVPFAATIAALQDWDAVFFFQYHSSDQDWYTDRVQRYFSFNGQPAKLALLSACANLYRRGDLAPLADQVTSNTQELLPATLGLSFRVGIDPKTAKTQTFTAPRGKRLASPRGDVVWDATDNKRAYLKVTTPATRTVWGLIGERQFDLSGVKLDVGQVERNYAAIVLTSMDARPLETSQRLLLTAVGSAENQNVGWNASRTSVGNRWGSGPARVNGIDATVQLPFRVSRVHALDGLGRRQVQLRLTSSTNETRFNIGPQYRTLWYEIEK